jgi:MYXO-CTERM domain-containing protein
MRTTLRSGLLASLLAGSAWTAQADPVNWEFTYTGFYASLSTTHRFEGTTHTEGFLPDAQVLGAFSGNDDDGDGVLELDELDSFVADNTQYLWCVQNPSPYGQCSIGHFSFALDSQALSFSGSWHGNDEFFSGWGGSITSGASATDYRYSDFVESTRSYTWTDATTLSLRQLPPPVPEPAAGAMALGGLLLLAGLRRRRAH